MNENQKILNKLSSIDWNFSQSRSGKSIHSLHPYPAKFIPEIPSSIIQCLHTDDNKIILDPFCGSGTSLRVAQEMHYESIGVDLNPIACMISKIKTTVLPERFLIIAKQIKDAVEKKKSADFIETIPNVNHWFNLDVQKNIRSLRNEIECFSEDTLKLHLNFCLSANIVRYSNQESDTRYAAIKKQSKADDLFKSFYNSAQKLAEQKSNHNILDKSVKVIEGNILELSPHEIDKPIGLLVTSPPYPNAYEYWLYHKYRMFWLGHDPIKVKNDEIGARPHYFKKNPQTEFDFQRQMRAMLENLLPKFSDGAFLSFVVGNSRIHGRDIENDKLIIEAAGDLGISHFVTLTRDIKQNRKSFNLRNSRLKSEKIVVLRLQ